MLGGAFNVFFGVARRTLPAILCTRNGPYFGVVGFEVCCWCLRYTILLEKLNYYDSRKIKCKLRGDGWLRRKRAKPSAVSNPMRAALPAARATHAAVHFRNTNADALNARFYNCRLLPSRSTSLRARGVMSYQRFGNGLCRLQWQPGNRQAFCGQRHRQYLV